MDHLHLCYALDDNVVDVDDVPEDMDENECILSMLIYTQLNYVTCLVSSSAEKNVASWMSDIYNHYHLLHVIKVEENGTVKYVFTCKQ